MWYETRQGGGGEGGKHIWEMAPWPVALSSLSFCESDSRFLRQFKPREEEEEEERGNRQSKSLFTPPPLLMYSRARLPGRRNGVRVVGITPQLFPA